MVQPEENKVMRKISTCVLVWVLNSNHSHFRQAISFTDVNVNLTQKHPHRHTQNNV